MAKTSINIKPCKVGMSRVHNVRDVEYTKRIPESKRYYRTDLTPRNESYVSPLMEGKTLDEWFQFQQKLYEAKVGQKMQLKDRIRVNKKTGRQTVIPGASPIREGVLVIKDDTTMEDVRRFCSKVEAAFNLKTLEIHIHRDEGHYEDPDYKESWVPNLHAHIVFNWMDLETGKSIKLNDKDMSMMQDIAAETLDMERGTSKSETNKEHLDRQDFIVAKQKEEARKAELHKRKAQQDEEKAIAEIEEIKQKGEVEAAKIEKHIAARQKNLNMVDNAVAEELDKYNALKEEYESLQSKMQMSKASYATYDEKKDWQYYVFKHFENIFVSAYEPLQRAARDIDAFAHANGIDHQDFFRPDQAANIRQILVDFSGEKSMLLKIVEWLISLAKRIRPMQLFEETKARTQLDGIAKGYYDNRINRYLGQGGGVKR